MTLVVIGYKFQNRFNLPFGASYLSNVLTIRFSQLISRYWLREIDCVLPLKKLEMNRTKTISPMLRRRRPVRHSRGAAVVEFAAIIPVLMLVLLGTIETCNMIFLQQSLEIAAYEAARVTIVPETDTADVETSATALLNGRRVNGAAITVTPNNFQNVPYGAFIRVDVSAPCNSNGALLPTFYGSKTLTGTVEMMKEF